MGGRCVHVAMRERVIEPVGEARNAFFIFAELADRLGYGHLYPQNEDELLRYVLQGSPFTLVEVRAAGGQVQVPPAIMQYKIRLAAPANANRWPAGSRAESPCRALSSLPTGS